MNERRDHTSNAPLKGWNHTLDGPLQVSPFYQWPPHPLRILSWVWNSWFFTTERPIIVAIALLSFYWFQPQLQVTQTLAFGWIAEMFVRNVIVMTIASGVTGWTAYELLMFWAMPNGFAPMLTWAATPVWFVALFVMILVWESFSFNGICRFYPFRSFINMCVHCITCNIYALRPQLRIRVLRRWRSTTRTVSSQARSITRCTIGNLSVTIQQEEN